MKKLHRQLFWLLVLLLPLQLGRHFWSEWTQVLGLPVDYLSPTLYLTDLLVAAVLIAWWWQEKKRFKVNRWPSVIKRYWWFGAIFLFLFLNSFLALNSGAAFYKLIKIIEFSLLGLYIAREKLVLRDLRMPLSGAIIYSSLIALAQFAKQASLDGLFWWLGERTFNIITPGIAKAIIGGRLILRPYAAFSHPNVLAGFLLISMILIAGKKEQSKFPQMIRWATLSLGSIALFLSFSRVAWFVGLLIGFWFLVQRWLGKKRSLIALVAFSILLGGLFYSLVTPLSGEEAIDQRLALANVAMEMVKANPLAGVGINNFISQLPYYWQQFGATYWLQPVHNIFLLVAAETGLIGLMTFFWLLILTFRRLLSPPQPILILGLSAALVLGLFDHYWLTLQQTQLLLTIIFGLSWRQ